MKPFNLEKAKAGERIQFRSGCECFFVAYDPLAKPHCQFIVRTKNGQMTYRYIDGKLFSSKFTIDDTGDIVMMDSVVKKTITVYIKRYLGADGKMRVYASDNNSTCRDRREIIKQVEVEYEDTD